MRPLWRKSKYLQRERERAQIGKSTISIDEVEDRYSYEIADFYDLEEDLMKRELLSALKKVLSTLGEIDRKIMELYGEGYSETVIGKEIGMSQRGVNKRKKKLFLKLKNKLIPYR